MIDYASIEKKWQKAWEESKLFEHDPNEKKPLLVTAAWPYTNMPPHIGHLRTYGTADFYSKYMRMRGYNVIFPMGWHYTGTPILAIIKRLQEKDQSLIEELKAFDISDEEIAALDSPIKVADLFRRQFKEAFIKVGMGIDWRRELKKLKNHIPARIDGNGRLANMEIDGRQINDLAESENPNSWLKQFDSVPLVLQVCGFSVFLIRNLPSSLMLWSAAFPCCVL